MHGYVKQSLMAAGAWLLAGALIGAAGDPAAAQNRQSQQVQKVIDELRGIVERGEKRRSADPRFLEELKALAAKYDWPWRRVVLRDRFRDGDYSYDPAWTVAAGRFWVDSRDGLRSRVEPYTRREPQQQQSGSNDLLGTVLRELARPEGGGQAEAEKVPSTPAVIFTRAAIGNAFAVRLRLQTVTNLPARIEFGPHLGAERNEGYRLVYHNRAQGGPVFELVQQRPWGSSVIFALDRAPRLDDGAVHRILWTRDAGGMMKVQLDGKPLLSARDRGLTRDFEGFTIVNSGGDYAITSVGVSDMPARPSPR